MSNVCVCWKIGADCVCVCVHFTGMRMHASQLISVISDRSFYSFLNVILRYD